MIINTIIKDINRHELFNLLCGSLILKRTKESNLITNVTFFCQLITHDRFLQLEQPHNSISVIPQLCSIFEEVSELESQEVVITLVTIISHLSKHIQHVQDKQKTKVMLETVFQLFKKGLQHSSGDVQFHTVKMTIKLEENTLSLLTDTVDTFVKDIVLTIFELTKQTQWHNLKTLCWNRIYMWYANSIKDSTFCQAILCATLNQCEGLALSHFWKDRVYAGIVLMQMMANMQRDGQSQSIQYDKGMETLKKLLQDFDPRVYNLLQGKWKLFGTDRLLKDQQVTLECANFQLQVQGSKLFWGIANKQDNGLFKIPEKLRNVDLKKYWEESFDEWKEEECVIRDENQVAEEPVLLQSSPPNQSPPKDLNRVDLDSNRDGYSEKLKQVMDMDDIEELVDDVDDILENDSNSECLLTTQEDKNAEQISLAEDADPTLDQQHFAASSAVNLFHFFFTEPFTKKQSYDNLARLNEVFVDPEDSHEKYEILCEKDNEYSSPSGSGSPLPQGANLSPDKRTKFASENPKNGICEWETKVQQKKRIIRHLPDTYEADGPLNEKEKVRSFFFLAQNSAKLFDGRKETSAMMPLLMKTKYSPLWKILCEQPTTETNSVLKQVLVQVEILKIWQVIV
ncbi:hypothetical protein RFI_01466 [Reticulomyxa filosa]|uniref:Uncharacterized protein n=1 Tax=Reticulomyxa filosa TaxID=46433 RepID=X6PAN2_RETFI|nr:hypothetical protein RFI_01466 [Reticulomyxa filosa]|eukprot:ETO35595.1 hypothetical protein RFI_01466 [Reticulomyxa filosa]